MADGMRHQGQSGYRHFLSISDRPSSPRRHDEDSSTARTSRRTPPRHSPVIRASRRRTAIPAWRPVLRPNRSASARRTSLSTTRQKSCLSRLTGAHQPRQRPQVRILPAISAQPRDDDALLVMSAHVAHKAWSKTLSASPQATSRPENTNAATTATATSNPAMLAAHAPRKYRRQKAVASAPCSSGSMRIRDTAGHEERCTRKPIQYGYCGVKIGCAKGKTGTLSPRLLLPSPDRIVGPSLSREWLLPTSSQPGDRGPAGPQPSC